MQHDVFVHPVARLRPAFPFIVVLQSDHAEGPLRLAAPLMRGETALVRDRALPRVEVEQRPFRIYLPGMVSLEVRQLRRAVGSIYAYRDDILRALDWLFVGF